MSIPPLLYCPLPCERREGDGGQTVGFAEAIEQSGWEALRQQEARRLCPELRTSLRRADYKPEPDQVYEDLDSDPLVPDTPAPRRPASRLALLDELLKVGGDLKAAANTFCHKHKMKGPEDKRAPAHTLGRVWSFRELSDLLQSQVGGVGSAKSADLLRKTIELASLEDQEEAFADLWFGDERKPMWSFYDPDSPHNPLGNLTGGRAATVDRLGLGEYHYKGPDEELVQWGHRLPDGGKAMRPTAWDGGAKRPYWRPGGRTHPLGTTGRFKSDGGLPEVVHAPVKGGDLAVRVSFVAG